MSTPNTWHHTPTCAQLQDLSKLCSREEWTALVRANEFLNAATVGTLAELETVMTKRLGRRISLSTESITNPGDEKL